MKYPVESVNFAGRLVQDDLTLLNEAIPLIVPESVEITDDKALTGRVILMSAVEKAVGNVKRNKVSLPGDLERIAELEAELKKVNKLASDLDQQLADKEQAFNLNAIKLEEHAEEIESLRIQASENGQKAATLEKYKPVENEMRLVLPPFTKELLVRYARKVSKKGGKEIQPGDLLISLFNRYITSHEVELDGFPLLISKTEMKTIHEQLKNANESAE